MSTATLPPKLDPKLVHYKILGRTRFKCVEPGCDGEHHVWCSCGH